MQPAIRLPDATQLSDAELLALARRRDATAVRVLVARHNQRLFRVARGVLRDDAEAEDVVQETYVRAFTRLDGFRGEAALTTWLTRIALNEALGRLRRRRPQVGLAVLDALAEGDGIVVAINPPTPQPDSEAGRAQVRAVLEAAIDRLPEIFRVVFVMRDIEGLSAEETGRLLGVRPETVKTRLHRARRQLRRSLEATFAASFGEVFPFDGARCAGMADRIVARLKAAER